MDAYSFPSEPGLASQYIGTTYITPAVRMGPPLPFPILNSLRHSPSLGFDSEASLYKYDISHYIRYSPALLPICVSLPHGYHYTNAERYHICFSTTVVNSS